MGLRLQEPLLADQSAFDCRITDRSLQSPRVAIVERFAVDLDLRVSLLSGTGRLRRSRHSPPPRFGAGNHHWANRCDCGDYLHARLGFPAVLLDLSGTIPDESDET